MLVVLDELDNRCRGQLGAVMLATKSDAGSVRRRIVRAQRCSIKVLI